MTNKKNNEKEFDDKSDEALVNDSDIDSLNSEAEFEFVPPVIDKSGSVKITTEEVSLVSDFDFNFPNLTFQKGIPVNFSKKAFEKLVKTVPNIEIFIKTGAIKIV